LASGDYATRAPEHGNDELNRLAHDFNRMAEAVEERIAALERSRAEIQKLNQSLETRVVERTRELAERNTQLAEAISHLHETQEYLVRSEKLAGLGMIVAAVAHELNSPIGNALTVATAFTEKTRTFQKEAAEGLRRSVLQTYVQDAGIAAELIERNIDRAAELIRSFKQVTVDQTSSQRRSFNLRQTLEELAATLRPTFKKNGYQLLLNIPANIDLDSYPGPLGQVISNFVTNALLHAFEGRRGGTMRLSCTPCGEDRIELLFEDDGKGIPAEHLPRIFDPFFTTRLGTGGSGLGLNIVHNIVTGLLGGEISVGSRPGQGTRFRILIPRQAPTTATAESSVAYANRMDTSPAPDNHVK
ncbi:MAG: HAMP domain-containing protein, partial [Gammaproteobacteria bacterium]|nr:HAMP domain-containing protein [Gammaproteobacteria bacterium]